MPRRPIRVPPGDGPATVLDIQDLSKSYGPTHALRGVSICFEAGGVHAILGENGSGKSTLVKLLSGIVAPTAGRIAIGGHDLVRATPAAVQERGVASVFQEVLIAERSVAENILLGLEGCWRWAARGRERQALAGAALARITTLPVDLSAPAGRQPLAVRQLIVLARALARGPRILILDEVTAALDFGDRELVFRCLEQFAAGGGLILFISHRMDEVMRLAHRISVLRSGVLVETLPRSQTSPEALLRMMAPPEALPRAPEEAVARSTAVLPDVA